MPRSADSGRPRAPVLGLDLDLDLVRVTEFAALAAGRWVGRGDAHGGAHAARAAARALLSSTPIRGTVAMGESGDGAIAAGEQVGDGTGPACDVAVAPLDDAALAALGKPNALSALAVATHGQMLRPSSITLMDKLVVGADACDAVDIDRPVVENVRAVAAATRRPVHDVTVAVLASISDRETVREVRDAGARVRPVSGGEISSAVAAAHPDSGIDMLLGLGGAREGVLAAAALACVGGSMQCRLRPRDIGERRKALDAGHENVDAVLHIRDLVGEEDILFIATGVTPSEDIPGILYRAGAATTHSVTMRSSTRTVRIVEGVHQIDRLCGFPGGWPGPCAPVECP